MKKTVGLIPLFLVCLVFIAPRTAFAAEDQARVFLEAVKNYDQGDYGAAAEGFLTVAQAGVVNGKLYYNIANAYLKAGDIGRAVLWYEKALRLIPNDPDLRFNLEYARSRVRDKAPDTLSLAEMLFFWRTWLGGKTVVILAAVFSLLFCLGVFFKKYLLINVPAFFRYGALALFLFFTLTAGGNYYFDQHCREGVVLADAVSAKSGFSDLSTELFVLHAGSRVTVEQAQKDFYRIRFGKDKIGWVDKADIGII
jgi:tetratricopeptide (TPR) repeat protein